MGNYKTKSYGKTVTRKAKRLSKPKQKYLKAIAKINEEYSYEQRKMNISKQDMAKYPNIFEVEE